VSDEASVRILAFASSPSVTAQETQQVLSKIPNADSPDAARSRESAKQTIEQASKLANGDTSRAITGAGISGLIENQAARTKALAQASRLAVTNPELTEQTVNVLAEAIKTTDNLSAKNQIQEAIAQIRKQSAPVPIPSCANLQ
jgi:hypothetical protein